MKSLISILIISCGFAGAIASADEATAEKAYWLCKNHKQVRTIRVHIDEKNVCSTFYTKEGSEKVVGSGKNHESCFNFLTSIKGNLEKSSWNCRDISDTKISSLE